MQTKKIGEIVEKLVHAEVDQLAKQKCSDEYYKNQYLEYAVMNHVSLPCIVRTSAEMLKTGSKFHSNPADDIFHAKQELSYINMYSDTKLIGSINNLFLKLEEEAHEKFPYLIAEVSARLKAFFSLELKIRLILLKKRAIPFIKENLRNLSIFSELVDEETFLLLKFFTDEDFSVAEEILDELYAKNAAKDPTRDIIGYRIVVRSYNTSTDESVLTDFVYEFSDFVIEFFSQKGIKLIAKKDYIANPNEKEYQSMHLIFDLMGIFVELQIRTANMDWWAEEGPAAHDSVYKNTEMYRFFKDFMYRISDKKSELNVKLNESLGLLKELTLLKRTWRFTPNEEIPETLEDLKDFAHPEILKKIFCTETS